MNPNQTKPNSVTPSSNNNLNNLFSADEIKASTPPVQPATQQAPVQPIQPAPVQEAVIPPVQQVPVQPIVQQAPVQPIQQAPVQEAVIPPVQAVPQQAPVQTIPPVQQTIAQPIPVQPIQPVQQSITQSTSPIQQTPTQLIPPIQPQNVVIKKGSKISLTGFLIGCGIFGFIMIGAIALVLYIALQNPQQFQGIIGIDGIKTGLRLFAGLFFGLLFLGGFIGSIFNIYKIINSKIGKFKYIIGTLFSIMLLAGSVYGGIQSFKTIDNIINTTGTNSTILKPTINFKGGERNIGEGFPIIAPTKVTYGVNITLFERLLTNSKYINKDPIKIELDCGNKQQILSYNNRNPNDIRFADQCLYMKKGSYPLSLRLTLRDKQTNIVSEEIVNVGKLNVVGEITLTPSQNALQFNDAYNEIIAGTVPVKMEFNAQSIFSDLGLSDYNIQRDFNDDGIFDRTNSTLFSQQFREAKVQKIHYQLTGLGSFKDLIYEFDMRILQSDVPICTINTQRDKNNPLLYTINSTFDDTQTPIVSYLYQIKDLATGKTENLPANRRTSFTHNFSRAGEYIVYLTYATDSNKIGKCESDSIPVGSADFTIDYGLRYKGSNDSVRNTIQNTTPDEEVIVSRNNDNIVIKSLPTRLQLTLNNISPQSSTSKTQILLDDKPILSPDGNTYEIILQNTDHKAIIISVSDDTTNASTVISIPLQIIQKDIIGSLQAFPDTVGTSPFEVTLDASTTRITDPDDEIIYFSWDFGNGEQSQNASQSKATYTYVYDDQNNNGSFVPSVTITTKKGKTATFALEKPILVTKPAIISSIIIESHPSQIATIGEQVKFALNTDGTPVNIERDFGLGEKITCEDRSCANIPMVFYEEGTYTITASLKFADLTTSTATTKLTIRK